MRHLDDLSGQLFNEIIKRFQLKTDSALAHKIGVTPSIISKIRNGKIPVSSDIILRLHETLLIPVAEMRTLMMRHPYPDCNEVD